MGTSPDPMGNESGPQLGYFAVGGERFAVISRPGPSSEALGCLTPAERDVCRHVQRGVGNQGVADARATSTHTIANQLASIYRKLGLASRPELVSYLVRHGQTPA